VIESDLEIPEEWDDYRRNTFIIYEHFIQDRSCHKRLSLTLHSFEMKINIHDFHLILYNYK